MELRDVTVPVADGHLAGTLAGEPDGSLVLLLHGGGQTRHSWRSTLEALAAAGRPALALDLRGHGDSSRSEVGYALDVFAGDIVAAISSLGLASVDFVGASLGGLVSLLIAGELRPDLCRSLILVDVAATVEPAGSRRIVEFMLADPDGFADLDQAAAAVSAYRGRPVESSEGLRKNLRRDDRGRWQWHWDRRFLVGEGRVDTFDRRRLTAAAAALEAPTLLVRGMLSDVLSEQGRDEFLALAPHAEVVDLSGTGHMVAGDDNDRFSGAVLEFLARRPA